MLTRDNGAPWHPKEATEDVGVAVATAGVKRVRVHDLRHTHATLWLKTGDHPKVLQERLGHKSIRITMDTCSDVSQNVLRGHRGRA